MKKLMCAILALALTLAMCFGALAEAADVTGTWYLNSVSMEDMELSAAMINMEATLTIGEDGSCEMVFGEESTTGTWETNSTGSYLMTDAEGTVQEFTLVDGVLMAEDEGMGMTFVREKPVLDTFVPGEVVADPALEDFDGEWTLTLIESAGLQISASDAGLELVITIANGFATIDQTYAGTTAHVESDGLFADGTLTITSADGASEMAFQLHDDGTMSWTQADGTIAYFQK